MFNPFTANPVKALHFAILTSVALALMTERQSDRCQKLKNGGLGQYGPEPFEQQQFGTAGVERVKQFVFNMKDTATFTLCSVTDEC